METGTLGLDSLWTQADSVTRAVALMLLVMSVASWYVMLDKLVRLTWHRLRSPARLAAFWNTSNLSEALNRLGSQGPYPELARVGVNAARQYREAQGRAAEQSSLSDWLNRALRQATVNVGGRLQAGMAVLATVGSSAPFVGLLGTVWGIYHALLKIGLSGDASIDKVAGPVGETLIMTALGLAVAIPATLGYNLLVRSNKQTLGDLANYAFELHDLLVVGARAEPSDGATKPVALKHQAEYV
jgi:biopolymer transport protein ExbB